MWSFASSAARPSRDLLLVWSSQNAIIQTFVLPDMQVTHPMRRRSAVQSGASKRLRRCEMPRPVTGVFSDLKHCGCCCTTAPAGARRPISGLPSPSGKSGDDVFFIASRYPVQAFAQTGLAGPLVWLQANQAADPTMDWEKKSLGMQFWQEVPGTLYFSRGAFKIFFSLLLSFAASPAISFKPDNEVAL
ncbi:hypothetical protein TARUN_9651 [Trichoderma arundinaceum]|uniref:Uncharacterized protein n=1 Tax=Trichoderma arundinaceum TaxID=490622 RepID=A0A395N9M8_TRIAR|nr:hypothetical protein TARUN_9651 [Trichoderma arundinaceum]